MVYKKGVGLAPDVRSGMFAPNSTRTVVHVCVCAFYFLFFWPDGWVCFYRPMLELVHMHLYCVLRLVVWNVRLVGGVQ